MKWNKNIYIMNSHYYNYNRLIVVSLLFSLFSNILFAQKQTSRKYVYVEAKEWNKKNPDLPKWKFYPSILVDSLDNIPESRDKLNKYGSLKNGPKFEATGFFRTRKHNNRWIMVDPEGNLHINSAVVGVRMGKGETNKKYFNLKFRNEEDWIKRTINELTSYGFNGAGTWSNEEAIRLYNKQSESIKFSYCPMLSLMSGYGKELKITRQLSGNIGYPNQCIRAFDPDFEKYCEKTIPTLIANYKDDPNVLGYFSDNELPISKSNLEGYLNLPYDDYGRKAAEKWLEEKQITKSQITDEHRVEFAGYVADKYYSTVNKVLKKYDPNHMYLGSRLHGGAKYIKEVIQAAGKYCDVISINYYGSWDVKDKDIKNWEEWSDKPFIITEFYTKANDSGLSNTTGAGWQVHTQKDRGIHYENFIIGLLESRNCVGWSWFKYQDNDPTAKGVDPSNLNSNKGCYDNKYNPYMDLIKSMRKVNTIRYGLMHDFLSKQVNTYVWPQKELGGNEKLFYNSKTFQDVRKRIEQFTWAQSLYEDLIDRLNGAIRKLPEDYKDIYNESCWTLDAAIYYRISGDNQYMNRVAENLIKYYKLNKPEISLFSKDPKRSTTNFWRKIMTNDSRYLLAYDLVKTHSLLVPYADLMEKRMYEIIDEGKLYEKRIKRLGNTQFWGVTGLGLYGYMLGDKEAVDIAINGTNGFKALLSKCRDGGRFWPEPKHYVASYVDCCMVLLAEAARYNGWPEDLYLYEDPQNGASMRKINLAMLSLCTPDGFLVATGENSEYPVLVDGKFKTERTAFFANTSIRENVRLPIYYSIYREPEIAWVMKQRPDNKFFDFQMFGNSALLYGADLDSVKVPSALSVAWQEVGDAIIRSDETEAYWKGKGLTVHIRNGASLQYHSNDDHCSININAYGKNLYNHWFTKWDYLCPRKGRANATPLSFTVFNQNTVAVDCKKPDVSNIHLGQNEPEREGLEFSEIERINGMKRISVSGEVYKGVKQTRTICVVDEYVLDLFSLESSKSHNYDYILHSWGKVDVHGINVSEPYMILNQEYGFGPIDGKSKERDENVWLSSVNISDPTSGKGIIDFFDKTDSLGIRAFLVPDENVSSKIITAYTPYYVDVKGWDHGPYAGMPDRKPMSVIRRECKSTTYITIHQPYSKLPKPMKVYQKKNIIIIESENFVDEYNIKNGEYQRRLL